MARVSLSNLQYTMLRLAADGVKLSDVGYYRQDTFSSLLRRQPPLITYRRGQFQLTREGRDALASFESSDVSRKHPSSILSRFVDNYLKE
jgi:hypothetical protein